MKKLTKVCVSILVGILLVILTFTIIVISIRPDNVKYGLTSGNMKFSDVGEDITEDFSNDNSPILVKSTDNIELLIYPDTTVSVKNKLTGTEYKTTQDSDIFTDEEKERLSPISISYLNNQSKIEKMYSSKDSVDKQQYRIYKNENKLRVEYILGENPQQEVFPTVIEKSRFEKLFLDKVDDNDAEYLRRRYFLYSSKNISDDELKNLLIKYPSLKSNDLYVLTGEVNHIVKKRLINISQKVGYSQADMQNDNKNNKIGEASNALSFKIAVEYELDGDSLVVTIPKDSIEFYRNNPILDISLFKYFCSVDGLEGNLLIPSESGALINNTGNNEVGNLTLDVYGKDQTTLKKEKASFDESATATFPIFGMYSSVKSMFAIIQSGAANADLNINRTANGAYVYPTFGVVQSDITSIGGKNESITCGNDVMAENISVRFKFFTQDAETISYSNMAQYYQEYLLKAGMLQGTVQAESPLFVNEIVGCVNINGKLIKLFPYEQEVPLTTFEQAFEIAKYFKNNGITNQLVKLNGWNKEGLFSQEPGKADFATSLGGKKGYSLLMQRLLSEEISAVTALTLPYYYNDKHINGYSPTKQSCRFANKSVVSLFQKNPIDKADDLKSKKTEVISPNEYFNLAVKYADNNLFHDSGYYLGKFGLDLNSDYNSASYYDRSKAKMAVEEALKKLNQSNKRIAVQDANSYMLPYVDVLDSVLAGSGGNKIFSQSIPFKQMVLHGYVEYSLPSSSYCEDLSEPLLKAIETGSGMQFSFIYNSFNKLNNTPYAFLNMPAFDVVKQQVASTYSKLNKALTGLQDKKMLTHTEVLPGVSKTVYENGTEIYVNFTSDEVKLEGIAIPGKWYYRNK